MSEATEILRIDRPHFTIEVSESLLRIDLKGSAKNDIEEALENKPVLKQTIGNILEMFIPLHVRLSDIDSVHMDKNGKVVITLPHRKDVVIPLEPEDAKRLVDKLNQLVPAAKDKELRRIIKEQRLERIEKAEHELGEEEMSLPVGAGQFAIPEPPGVLEEEKKEEEEQEDQAGQEEEEK